MSDIDIRPARPDDAPGIVEAIRSGIEPNMLDKLIYGCAGIVDYVRDQINSADLGSDTVYTVASLDDRVIGAVELRLWPGAIFINYISMLPQFRSMGLGKDLLGTATRFAADDGASELLLDVMDTNKEARRWYDRLGFVEVEASAWSAVEIIDAAAESQALVSGYPQARACWRRYGFGQFTVVTAKTKVGVGLLGRKWFRVTEAAGLGDPSLHSALRRMDASRKILTILPLHEQDGVCSSSDNYRRLATSHRLKAQNRVS